ncbi:MAG: type II secretion system protein [Planctomycetota bacterium]
MKVESPFSYVEMLVVVTILALAASVVVPRLRVA